MGLLEGRARNLRRRVGERASARCGCWWYLAGAAAPIAMERRVADPAMTRFFAVVRSAPAPDIQLASMVMGDLDGGRVKRCGE